MMLMRVIDAPSIKRKELKILSVTYIENADFVDSLALGVRLCSQILVDILEVRNGDILLELFV